MVMISVFPFVICQPLLLLAYIYHSLWGNGCFVISCLLDADFSSLWPFLLATQTLWLLSSYTTACRHFHLLRERETDREKKRERESYFVFSWLLLMDFLNARVLENQVAILCAVPYFSSVIWWQDLCHAVVLYKRSKSCSYVEAQCNYT